jgi:hypothetical protein
MRAVADNDILLKGSCYGLLPVFMACVPGNGAVGILGASRFVVPKMIVRNQLRGNPATAGDRFAAFVTENEVVEPSPDEQQMAGLLEAAAQRMALNLDAGESQLVAIVVSRALPCMLTGDKRAIASLEVLFDSDARLQVISGKLKCLEQLVSDALVTGDWDQIRRAICGEPSVDKTLSICFSCSSPGSDPASVLEGLASYIADLRARAARVLST